MAVLEDKPKATEVTEKEEKREEEVTESKLETAKVEQPDTSSVLMPRPAARSVLVILAAIIFLNGLGALALAFNARDSLFWAMINVEDFDFPFSNLVFWGLAGVGILSVMLMISTYCLLQDPQGIFRYFGAFFSLSQAALLLIVGISAVTQATNIATDIDLLCAGGFP